MAAKGLRAHLPRRTTCRVRAPALQLPPRGTRWDLQPDFGRVDAKTANQNSGVQQKGESRGTCQALISYLFLAQRWVVSLVRRGRDKPQSHDPGMGSLYYWTYPSNSTLSRTALAPNYTLNSTTLRTTPLLVFYISKLISP